MADRRKLCCRSWKSSLELERELASPLTAFAKTRILLAIPPELHEFLRGLTPCTFVRFQVGRDGLTERDRIRHSGRAHHAGADIVAK